MNYELIASLIAAVTGFFAAAGSIYSNVTAKNIQKMAQDFERGMKERDRQWEREFAKIGEEIKNQVSFEAAIKAKQVDVLVEIFKRSGSIHYLLEAFVVPDFYPSRSGVGSLLAQAKEEWRELRKFILQNQIFLPADIEYFLGEMMGIINTMDNNKENWKKRAEVLRTRVSNARNQLYEQVKSSFTKENIE
ncbi:MAG: hypothetical protein ACTTJV_02260 [Ottowia sp.]